MTIEELEKAIERSKYIHVPQAQDIYAVLPCVLQAARNWLLVLKMPVDVGLDHIYDDGWEAESFSCEFKLYGKGDTPEEALRAALGEK